MARQSRATYITGARDLDALATIASGENPDGTPFDAASITLKTATIANAGTTSGVVDLSGVAVCGIEMPATVTGTTLTLHGASTSGGTYAVLRDSTDAALAITTASGHRHYIDPLITAGWPYIKVVLSAQSQETIVTLLCRPV